MIRRLLPILVIGVALASPSQAATNAPQTSVIVVVGAPGEEEFGKQFTEWSSKWMAAATKASAKSLLIGTKPETNDLTQIEAALAAEPKESASELWLVLIGHGTFAANEAAFNLRGPDLTAARLATLLKPFKRPVAVIDCASSSGPFVAALSGPNRVVITATRSGAEVNFSRFGQHMADAIGSTEADLDKDGQTSLLEAFILGSARTQEFYKSNDRLATEHALLEDNGDGMAVQGDWFRGIRAVKKAKDNAPADGTLANQFVLIRSDSENRFDDAFRARRSQLEGELEKLRQQKATLSETDYLNRMEPIAHALARTYAHAEGRGTIVAPQADGTVSLLARDAFVHGTLLRYEPQPHKNTLGYWTRSNDWASWSFTANKAGDYDVEILQACGKGSGGSRIALTSGTNRIETAVFETGAFTNFVWRGIGSMTLPAGTNSIEVRALSKPGAAVMDLREVRLKPKSGT